MSDDQHPAPEQPLSFAELLDWVEGRLTREAAEEMRRRVESAGPATQKALDWIQSFRRVALANPLPEPPPLLRQRLTQSFERHHGNDPELERLLASLSFDSRDDAALIGVRGGAEVDESYSLAFTADRFGILLDVLPQTDGTVVLDGQVLATGTDTNRQAWAVTVEHPGGSASDIEGSELGTFAIRGVPTDVSTMRLSDGRTEIVVETPLGSGW